MLRIATISENTEAEGPGRRWSIWVQGCTIRCPSCCNPEMFVRDGGTARSPDELGALMAGAAARGVEGISVLGGEPFEQAAGVAELARRARALGLTVMIYSGYTIEEIRARGDDAAALLALTDLLVDGRYDRDQPEPPPPIGRRWIGSSNQRMLFLSDAYDAEDPRMRAANTVELHLSAGQILVNGWPAGADALAKLARRR